MNYKVGWAVSGNAALTAPATRWLSQQGARLRNQFQGLFHQFTAALYSILASPDHDRKGGISWELFRHSGQSTPERGECNCVN